MSGWLLDTNVLSAFGPGKRPLASEIIAWFAERAGSLYLSTVTAAEIEAGIAKLRRTGSEDRADNLRGWLDWILDDYAERMLPFDRPAARIAGVMDDAARAIGRHPGFTDIVIASIARSRALVVLTANTRHFEPLGVVAMNPFAAHG